MVYKRPRGTNGAGGSDFLNARLFEEEVGGWLGQFKVGNLDAVDRLDWWVPGCYVEVKEKRQKLSQRWCRAMPSVPQEHLFVLDELSVRRAAGHFPHAYFVLRDCPGGDRIFVARVDEVFCAERVRLNRAVTQGGTLKGKWLLDLRNFRQLDDPGTELLPLIFADQTALPWKESACLSQSPIPEV